MLVKTFEKGKVRELEKYPDKKKTSKTYEDKVKSFNLLFDICSCKCYKYKGITEREKCTCSKSNAVPIIEWKFWIDQHTKREEIIGNIDKATTSKILKRETRMLKTKAFESRGKDSHFPLRNLLSLI